MAAFIPTRMASVAVLMAVGVFGFSGAAPAQILPWEVTVAEVEAGRLRNLAQRLNKQNLLYQLRLGEVTKSDMVATATQIDRVIESLQRGSPSHSIPSPWTKAIERHVLAVDAAWGPLRRIAIASPYEYIRVSREFMPPARRKSDPLLIRYFDTLSTEFASKSEALLDAYHEACLATGLDVCPTAHASGYAAMLIERATKEAVYIVAGLDSKENRVRLRNTIDEYQQMQHANDESPFFDNALDPDRGISARAAGQLLESLREDWATIQAEFTILAAGDEKNFDLRVLLATQARLVDKVERLSAALVRYASLTYGS